MPARRSRAVSRFWKSARKALRIAGLVLAVLFAVGGVLFLLAGTWVLPRAYFAMEPAPGAVNMAVFYGAAFWLCAVGEALSELWQWISRRLKPKACPQCRSREFAEAAFHLSGGIEESSFIWCPNGHLMTPVLAGNGDNLEVA